jgi:hypothetical protein
MIDLWTKNKEIEFFIESQKFATPEQLFYIGDDSRYYAYWPKSYVGKKTTLQSRNALIGNFTERYSVNLLQAFANSQNLYAVQSVICNEIGLSAQSPADVALCKSRQREQPVSNIKAIFEVKMSIVWNWELKDNKLICIGDFRTHKGNPGLLRSDTMLKAIGKSINIRVSGYEASQLPIIILGNTPIMESYISKVDHLRKAGIVQGFWSVNPFPTEDNSENIKETPAKGFTRMDSYGELEGHLKRSLFDKLEFFSGMKSKGELGRIIEMANRELTFEKKAEQFLSLIRD